MHIRVCVQRNAWPTYMHIVAALVVLNCCISGGTIFMKAFVLKVKRKHKNVHHTGKRSRGHSLVTQSSRLFSWRWRFPNGHWEVLSTSFWRSHMYIHTYIHMRTWTYGTICYPGIGKYAYIHTCMHISIQMHACMALSGHWDIYMYAYMYTYIHMSTCTYGTIRALRAYAYIHTCICIYPYECMHAWHYPGIGADACIHKCTYIHLNYTCAGSIGGSIGGPIDFISEESRRCINPTSPLPFCLPSLSKLLQRYMLLPMVATHAHTCVCKVMPGIHTCI